MTKQLIMAFSIFACGVMYADQSLNQNVRLSNQQQTVQISLPANGTTGYQWFVQSYDHELLDLQSYRYVESNSQMLGRGGMAMFVFSVDPRFYDAPQSSSINFVYNRPWAPSDNASTAEVTISSTSSSNDSMNWQKYPAAETTAAVPATSSPSSKPDSTNWISLPNSAANS